MEELKESVFDSGIPHFNEDDAVTRIQSFCTSQIKILHLTDIHLQFEKIKLLQNWYFQKGKRKYDYILLSGDIGTINHDDSPTLEEVQYQEEQVKAVLEELEKFGVPIYYVGGNHDPECLFKPSAPQLTKNSQNVHNQLVQLKPNLYLISLGGSVPSLYQKYETMQLDPIYFPYPYKSEVEFKREVDELLMQAKSQQIIVMTHDGPQGLSTSHDKTTHLGQGIIIFGSKLFYETLLENQERIVCNIHGHCHDGSNVDKINQLRVINSGALKFGEFGEINLQEGADSRWRVSKVTKRYLH